MGRVPRGEDTPAATIPRLIPRVLAHERNEPDLAQMLLVELLVGLTRVTRTRLLQARVGPDRNHQAPADGELVAQLPAARAALPPSR